MPSPSNASLRRTVSLIALAAALGALAACNQAASNTAAANTATNLAAAPDNALPPIDAAVALVNAPAADALPAAAPAPVAHVANRTQGYAYADRAYAMSTGFAAAPPDYTYDYNGQRPWVWRGSDGSERVVEAVPGGQRVYYYEPGARQPFFVQDPQYGYGYQDGALVSVYDQSGRALADAQAEAQAQRAGRYLARARRCTTPRCTLSAKLWPSRTGRRGATLSAPSRRPGPSSSSRTPTGRPITSSTIRPRRLTMPPTAWRGWPGPRRSTRCTTTRRGRSVSGRRPSARRRRRNIAARSQTSGRVRVGRAAAAGRLREPAAGWAEWRGAALWAEPA